MTTRNAGRDTTALCADVFNAATEAYGTSLPGEIAEKWNLSCSQRDSLAGKGDALTKVQELQSQHQAVDNALLAHRKKKPELDTQFTKSAEAFGKAVFLARKNGVVKDHPLFAKRDAAETAFLSAQADLEAAQAKPGASFWTRAAATFSTLGPSSRVKATEKACSAEDQAVGVYACEHDLLAEMECKDTQAAIKKLRAAHQAVLDLKAKIERVEEEKQAIRNRLCTLTGADTDDNTPIDKLATVAKERLVGESQAAADATEDALVLLLQYLQSQLPDNVPERVSAAVTQLLTAMAIQSATSSGGNAGIAIEEWEVWDPDLSRAPLRTQQVSVFLNASILNQGVLLRPVSSDRWRVAAGISHFAKELQKAKPFNTDPKQMRSWPSGAMASVRLKIPSRKGIGSDYKLLSDGVELCRFNVSRGLPRHELECEVGPHVFVLETFTVGQLALDLYTLGAASRFVDMNRQEYSIGFPVSGHYDITWSEWPTMSWPKITVAYSLDVKKLAATADRQKKLVGLWAQPGDASKHVLVTEDGWMLMPDGESAKYSWRDKDTVIFEADEDNDEAVFKVASLTEHEMVLVIEGQILRFQRGQTLTEVEAARLRAEAEERAVILRAKAKQAAAEVGKGLLKGAAVLALVSVAAVGAVAVAAASGSGGGSGRGYGGGGYGGDADDDHSSRPSKATRRSPSPSRSEDKRPEKEALGMPQPLRGCVVRKVQERQVMCSHKCEYCGWVDGSTFSVSRVGIGGTNVMRSSFVCGKCKKQQPYEISR